MILILEAPDQISMVVGGTNDQSGYLCRIYQVTRSQMRLDP